MAALQSLTYLRHISQAPQVEGWEFAGPGPLFDDFTLWKVQLDMQLCQLFRSHF